MTAALLGSFKMFQSVFIAIYIAEVKTDCGDRLGRQEVEGKE